MKESLKNVFLKNTAANYMLVATKFITAIFKVRLLLEALGDVSYGFWALIWSIFGYSLLLDFGFGTSVQKYTAELSATKDIKKYNRVISSVVTFYGFMSIFIIAATIGMQFFLTDMFSFPEGTDIIYYRKVFVFFGIGVAFIFPSGTFAEVLHGLNKIFIKNIVVLFFTLIEFSGIFVIWYFGKGLWELALFSIGLYLLNNIIMAFFAFKNVPEMKISVRLFDPSVLKEIVSFSFFAYLIMFANIVIYKTDQIVVGAMLGVVAVTVYQIGSKVPMILMQLSTQFQQSMAPMAAKMYKAGDHERLQTILINSNRFIAFLTAILFIIFTMLAEPILFVWIKRIDLPTTQIAWLLNVSVLFAVVLRSGSVRVLLMTDSHKFLSKIAVAESIMNLLFSIIFIHLYGVIGVAMGTLVPNIVLSIFFIFPKACKFSKVSMFTYIFKIYLPILFISLPSIAILYLFKYYLPTASWNFLHLVISSAAASIPYFILSYIFLLTRDDKLKLKGHLKSIVNKFS